MTGVRLDKREVEKKKAHPARVRSMMRGAGGLLSGDDGASR